MEKIIWNKRFSVGVRKLDDQHQKIIKMLNKLIDMKETRVDSEIISDTLTQMTRYASEHFKFEENLMDKDNYPDYLLHKEQHRQFQKQTVEFCMDTMSYKETIPVEILTFLKEWWINHILDSDMNCKRFFFQPG
jgi:hemerythrin